MRSKPREARVRGAHGTRRWARWTARSGAGMNRHAASGAGSAMLFAGGGGWLEKIRFGARGSMVLASIEAAVRAAHMDSRDAFHVSVIASRDVVPSVTSLLSWSTPFFDRTPLPRYRLLVQSPGSAPYVLCKRYSDFKQLHAGRGGKGLAADVGPTLELPAGFGSFSSDPSVVARRKVATQRYMDALAVLRSRRRARAPAGVPPAGLAPEGQATRPGGLLHRMRRVLWGLRETHAMGYLYKYPKGFRSVQTHVTSPSTNAHQSRQYRFLEHGTHALPSLLPHPIPFTATS